MDPSSPDSRRPSYVSSKSCAACRTAARNGKNDIFIRRCGQCQSKCCRHTCPEMENSEGKLTCWPCRREHERSRGPR